MRPGFAVSGISWDSFSLVSIGLCLDYKYIKSLRLKVDVLTLFSAVTHCGSVTGTDVEEKSPSFFVYFCGFV